MQLCRLEYSRFVGYNFTVHLLFGLILAWSWTESAGGWHKFSCNWSKIWASWDVSSTNKYRLVSWQVWIFSFFWLRYKQMCFFFSNHLSGLPVPFYVLLCSLRCTFLHCSYCFSSCPRQNLCKSSPNHTLKCVFGSVGQVRIQHNLRQINVVSIQIVNITKPAGYTSLWHYRCDTCLWNRSLCSRCCSSAWGSCWAGKQTIFSFQIQQQ